MQTVLTNMQIVVQTTIYICYDCRTALVSVTVDMMWEVAGTCSHAFASSFKSCILHTVHSMHVPPSSTAHTNRTPDCMCDNIPSDLHVSPQRCHLAHQCRISKAAMHVSQCTHPGLLGAGPPGIMQPGGPWPLWRPLQLHHTPLTHCVQSLAQQHTRPLPLHPLIVVQRPLRALDRVHSAGDSPSVIWGAPMQGTA